MRLPWSFASCSGSLTSGTTKLYPAPVVHKLKSGALDQSQTQSLIGLPPPALECTQSGLLSTCQRIHGLYSLCVARPEELGMRIPSCVNVGAQRLEREVAGHAALTGNDLTGARADPRRQAYIVEVRTTKGIAVADATLVGWIDKPGGCNVGSFVEVPEADAPVLDLSDIGSQE